MFEWKVRHSGVAEDEPRKGRSQESGYCLTPNSDYCLICKENFQNYFKVLLQASRYAQINSSISITLSTSNESPTRKRKGILLN